MHRLPVPFEVLNETVPSLPEAARRHLKVLRPKNGEEIELFDGRGHTRRCVFSGMGLTAAAGVATFPPPAARLTLFACITKGSRWDWTIEKAVELGIGRIVPVLSERCIVRLSAAEREPKAERWRRIAEDAARQSDAVWLPEVLPPVDFAAALELVKTCDRVFVGALTQPPPPPLLTALGDGAAADIGFFVGPEGDFTPGELAALLKWAEPVSLGPTILRAETAAIFGLSALTAALHAHED